MKFDIYKYRVNLAMHGSLCADAWGVWPGRLRKEQSSVRAHHIDIGIDIYVFMVVCEKEREIERGRERARDTEIQRYIFRYV